MKNGQDLGVDVGAYILTKYERNCNWLKNILSFATSPDARCQYLSQRPVTRRGTKRERERKKDEGSG